MTINNNDFPTRPAGPGDTRTTGERVSDRASELRDRTSDRATELRDRAADKAAELKDRATDKAAELKDLATDKAAELKDRAAHTGQQASERLDAAMHTTGERLTDAAQALRQHAPAGQAGDVAYNAARALDRSGEYLQQADPAMVRGDLETLIRKHPIEALAIGLGIGFLIGKSMHSRRNRYG